MMSGQFSAPARQATMPRNRHALLWLILICVGVTVANGGIALTATAAAQPIAAPVIPRGGLLVPRPKPEPEPIRYTLLLSALLSDADTQPVRSGLKWRVFDEEASADGSHKLVAESSDATPSLSLPDGTYIV